MTLTPFGRILKMFHPVSFFVLAWSRKKRVGITLMWHDAIMRYTAQQKITFPI